MSAPIDDGTVAANIGRGSHRAPDPAATPAPPADVWAEPGAPGVAAPTPAAPGSPLVALRDRKKQLADELYIDLLVPRWKDPLIYVRYRPAKMTAFASRAEKAQQQNKKPEDWLNTLNSDLLVKSCIGVFAIEGEPLDPDPEIAARDPRPRYSLRDGDPHGSWTKFDPDLAHSLGLPSNCGAIAVVQELYFTDGDIGAAVTEIMKFSGINPAEQEQAFFGS